jgi:hypothetical protein
VIGLPVGNCNFPALQRRWHDSYASRRDMRESLLKVMKGGITKLIHETDGRRVGSNCKVAKTPTREKGVKS